MQFVLQQSLLRARGRLVRNSRTLFATSIDHSPRLEGLFVYLNVAMALIENTLHQIYYKAKYDVAAMGWTFDAGRVGSPTGRRFNDKLRWIGMITGRSLDNMGPVLERVRELKAVRNHINHFDPPVFAFTIEDAADWLSSMFDVGVVLWEIRKRVGAPLTKSLIEVLMAPPVEWVPRDPRKRRIDQPLDKGYRSCQWPAPGES